MSKRALIPVVVGLAVGVVAIKLTMDVLSKAKGANQSVGGVKIVVAKARIPRENAIQEEHLKVVEVAETLVPEQAFADPKAVVGRVAAQHIPPGMFISEPMLRPPGAKAGLAAAIPPGYRAVAVKVDEYSAVGNWLEPDARVDMLVVMRGRRGGKMVNESRVVLRHVKVLAVGRTIDATGSTGAIKGRSVTLLVRAEDAQKVHLAATKGRIRFALRGGSGEGDDELEMVDFAADDAEATDSTDKPSFFKSMLAKIAENAANSGLTGALALAGANQRSQSWTVELIRGRSDAQRIEKIEFAGPRSSKRVSGDRSKQAGLESPITSPPAKRVTPPETMQDNTSGQDAADSDGESEREVDFENETETSEVGSSVGPTPDE